MEAVQIESTEEIRDARKGPITVKLDEPIRFGAETISEITLKPPKAKHIKHINPKTATLGDLLQIASKVSGVSMAVLDEMSMSDTTKVGEAVGEYF